MSEGDIERILERIDRLDEKIDGIHIQLVSHLAATGGTAETSRSWSGYLLGVGMLIVAAISAYGAFVK